MFSRLRQNSSSKEVNVRLQLMLLPSKLNPMWTVLLWFPIHLIYVSAIELTMKMVNKTICK